MAAQTAATETDLTGILLCAGNPLLDISAEVPMTVLEKYGVSPNSAILAEEQHQPLFKELVDDYAVKYIAGGATQNSCRVCQWMTGTPGATSYFGCIGDDAFGKQMTDEAAAIGMNVQYLVDPEQVTGTCAVLVDPTGERSLVTNLAAANHFKATHLADAAQASVIEKAKYYYMAGFFLTVSLESIETIGRHAVEQKKLVMMNLSAPFIVQFFWDQLNAAMPYVDIMFGNESEAEAFGEKMGWGTDIAVIAQGISALPKASGFRGRTVIITQGCDATIVAKDGEVMTFPVTVLPKEKLVDTNGAGDAFVGGFMSQLIKGEPLAKCVDAGHWASTVIIQESGCTYPAECTYA